MSNTDVPDVVVDGEGRREWDRQLVRLKALGMWHPSLRSYVEMWCGVWALFVRSIEDARTATGKERDILLGLRMEFAAMLREAAPEMAYKKGELERRLAKAITSNE